ncbi:hypothetical protein PoB_001660100 [Plakobranchus ocellatus]|uniref:Uncharacterized protein n=1 Tax=Plakobranchus ocellatus TaxID=259542 RepID=A0AAV3YSL7_9GAST|nr:hypothetical protein PoB_001660100 [Plakobranchus ocellatus]
MSTRNYFVLRDKDSNIDDSTFRNRWKWDWMDRIVQVGEDHERLGLFIQKLMMAEHTVFNAGHWWRTAVPISFPPKVNGQWAYKLLQLRYDFFL